VSVPSEPVVCLSCLLAAACMRLKVAKVTSDRAYSVALLPSASAVVVAVGDKSGNLGLWNYSSQHLYPDTDGWAHACQMAGRRPEPLLVVAL